MVRFNVNILGNSEMRWSVAEQKCLEKHRTIYSREGGEGWGRRGGGQEYQRELSTISYQRHAEKLKLRMRCTHTHTQIDLPNYKGNSAYPGRNESCPEEERERCRTTY